VFCRLTIFAAAFCLIGPSFADDAPPNSGGSPNEEARPSAEEAIQRALDETTVIDGHEFLKDVVQDLAQKHHIQIQLDTNVDPGTAAPTSSLRDIPLRVALTHILNEQDLTYTVKNGILLITTKDRALKTVTYDVRDLVASDNEADDLGSLNQLADAVSNVIEPQSWKSNDNRELGSIRALQDNGSRTLVVSHNNDVQELISRFLANLRTGKSQQSLAEEKLKDVLSETTEMEFPQTPLKDVVAYVSERHHIPVVFDINALKGAKSPIDPSRTLVTATLKNVWLSSALTTILAQFDLSYIIKHDALVITTKDRALVTRVYDARDLLPHKSVSDDAAALNRLGTAIVEKLAKETWKPKGTGAIRPFASKGTSVLVVRQRSAVHEQLDEELADLRQMIKSHDGKKE
jgi:hypothetical protein